MESPSHGHPIQRIQNPRPHHMPMPRNHRPLMAIDVAPHSNGPVRHQPLALPPPLSHNGEMMNPPMPIRPNSTKMAGPTGSKSFIRGVLISEPSDINGGLESQRTRSKKITVACNFCRCKSPLDHDSRLFFRNWSRNKHFHGYLC
jgi:hypothetical protein